MTATSVGIEPGVVNVPLRTSAGDGLAGESIYRPDSARHLFDINGVAGVITNGSGNIIANNRYNKLGVETYNTGRAATQWRFAGRFVEEEGLVVGARWGGDVLVGRDVRLHGRGDEIPPWDWKFKCIAACMLTRLLPYPLCVDFCTALAIGGCDALFQLCGAVPGDRLKEYCLLFYDTVCSGE